MFWGEHPYLGTPREAYLQQLESYLNPTFDPPTNKKHRKYHKPPNLRKLFNLDIRVSHNRLLESVRTELTNVERTIFTLVAAAIAIIAAIFFVTVNTEWKATNPPNLLQPLDSLSASVFGGISYIEGKYTELKKRVEISKDNFNDRHGSLICPQGRNGLETITTCVFGYGDLLIFHVLDGLENASRYVYNVFGFFIQRSS